MSDDLIARARALAAKATPGPLQFIPQHIAEGPSQVRAADAVGGYLICETPSDDLAELFALAPEIAAELVRMSAERDCLVNENAKLRASRATSDGWLYFNPDTGTEWAEQHPIESGEVSDAQNVRPGTAMALQHELIAAWDDLRRMTAERDVLRGWVERLKVALRPFCLSFDSEERHPINPDQVVCLETLSERPLGKLRGSHFFDARSALADEQTGGDRG